MLRTLTIATLLALASTHAAAINKCTIDGRVTFQDAPCPEGTGGAIEVRPSSLPPPATSPAPDATPATSADQAASDAQRDKVDDMRARAAAAEKERAAREIDHKIKVVEQKLRTLEKSQAAELAALSRKKGYATNNLAGATWEASISQEQQAVMSKYESRMKNERSKLEMLIEQRGRL
jgi:hypothetical protein